LAATRVRRLVLRGDSRARAWRSEENRDADAESHGAAALVRHGTESGVLIEAVGEGIDWNCFEAACLKLWARSDLRAASNEVALFICGF
jgi:hypothetical protein